MRTAHISTAARVPRSASSLSLLTCLMTGVVYTPPVLRRISIRNITNIDTRGHLRNFAKFHIAQALRIFADSSVMILITNLLRYWV